MRTFALSLALLALVACASGGRHATAERAAPAGKPWELPADAIPSQRIYQGSYRGPEGGGSFRATLRLQAPDRFRIEASDRLGRVFWSAGLMGDRGWWVDHRAGTWCDELDRLSLPGIGAGPVPGEALPAILLGVLPAAPAGEASAGAGAVELTDGAGRHWEATLQDGRVATWTLFAGSEPLWWWRRHGRGGLLSQRQGRQLEWEEVVAEPLRGDLPPFEPPRGYERSCDARAAP
jgi:hypothetical protein